MWEINFVFKSKQWEKQINFVFKVTHMGKLIKLATYPRDTWEYKYYVKRCNKK